MSPRRARRSPPRPEFAVSLGFVYGAIETGYSRYVAIGDSQTEGLWDGNDAVGFLGFADRLAGMIDSIHPGLRASWWPTC
jgi:lysophospholipase L1-like esterase